MSTHPPELTPEDAAEVEIFRTFLRRAGEGPQGDIQTYGDLYDEMYGNGDRMEDVEDGKSMGDGGASHTQAGA